MTINFRKLCVLLLALFVSCANKKKDRKLTPPSIGETNSIIVVAETNLWQSMFGEFMRESMWAEIYGLPQKEPHFDLMHVTPSDFEQADNKIFKNKAILRIVQSDYSGVKFFEDLYSSPQLYCEITASSEQDLIEILRKNSEHMLKKFKAVEFEEKSIQLNNISKKNSQVKRALNVKIDLPRTYRIATERENFFWIRKDNENVSLNLMLYSIPTKSQNLKSLDLKFVSRKRDSISTSFVPGQFGGKRGDFMIIEPNYKPSFTQGFFENLIVYEMRSLWKVKETFMSGPFVNYCFVDKKNNRLLFADGFVYAPSKRKRDYLFELETIIRSIKFF